MKCESFTGRYKGIRKKEKKRKTKRKKKYEALSEAWTEVVADDIKTIAEGGRHHPKPGGASHCQEPPSPGLLH